MKDLNGQLEGLLDKWFSEKNLRDGEKNLLTEVGAESIENTRVGTPYHATQKYDNTYESAYAKKTGRSTGGPVTLRNKRKRIEEQKVSSSGDHSILYFRNQKMGEIANYQHDIGNYGKIRKIWPDKIQDISVRALNAAKDFFIKKINGS